MAGRASAFAGAMPSSSHDPYQSVVGPTGRGITGEIVTYSHPDDRPLPKAKGKRSRDGQTLLPSSLDDAFVLDGPGEYEVRDVLLTGVRTYRDDAKGVDRGKQTAFVVELDGMHTIHLGEIGHLLTEEKLGDIGPVDIACVPIGGLLSTTKTAELVAQLDPRIVVAMPLDEDAPETARGAREVLPRDGRRPDAPAAALGHDLDAAGRDDGRAARVARQGLGPRRTAAPGRRGRA